MKFIWQNYDTEKTYHVDELPFSPFMEYSNASEQSGITYLNPIPRFFEIFAPLLSEILKPDFADLITQDNIKSLENCLFHYLAWLDLRTGLHKSSICEYRLHNDLSNGKYGKEAQVLYSGLDERQQRIIQFHLAAHNRAQGRQSFFWYAINDLLPHSLAYFHQSDKKFLLCLGYSGSEKEKNLLRLLQYLFFDLGAEIDVFWNSHFGIIGEEQTMQLGQTIIY